MTVEQREKLLTLHRATTIALDNLHESGKPGDVKAYYAADDAFREYLFSLEVSA